VHGLQRHLREVRVRGGQEEPVQQMPSWKEQEQRRCGHSWSALVQQDEQQDGNEIGAI
jgi:hypothetical protein